MTTEAAATTAAPAETAVETASNDTQTTTAAPAETAPAQESTAPTFKVPDAYKEKPWAEKLKSEEDLYKQIDNLSGLVGKKTLPPINLKEATPEQLETHFNTYRPENKEAYKFGEGSDPEFTTGVSEVLYNVGISEYQGNKLIPAYQALEKKAMEKATSADGFKAVMTEQFGEKFDGIVVNSTKVFKDNLSEKNQQILDSMPNQYLGAVYELAHKMSEKIDAVKKQYGVVENGDAHLNKGGQIAKADITEVRKGLRAKLADMDNRPHTQQEKDVLLAELDKTYR